MNVQEMQELAESVAAELTKAGHPFTVDTDSNYLMWDHGRPLIGEGGAGLFLRRETYPTSAVGKVTVTGCFPRNSAYPSPDRGDASVTIARGPAVIAREIVRRLLPTYLPELERVRADINKDERAAAARAKLAAQLADILPGGSVGISFADRAARSTNVSVADFGSFRVNYGADKVTVKLHGLPADVAVAVARALAGGES